MEQDKQREFLQDVTGECGCYELGDVCYDRQGEYTHEANEECTQ